LHRSPIREEQELARKQWEEERMAKCRAAYAPLLPPENALYAAVLADMRRQNAEQPIPDPVCKTCGFPTSPQDMHPLFKKQCEMCASRRLDKIILRIRRRLGRRAAVRALRRLARGK
jgi:hypothetical protein